MQRRISFILTVLLGAVLLQTSYASAPVGHVMVMDPILGPRDIVFEKVAGYAIAEGDIIIQKLSNSDEHHKPQALILLKLGGARWPQGVVRYEINESLSLPSKMAIIEAMATWERSTHVRFAEVTEHERNNQTDYLSFIPTNANTCSSFVGKQGGAQVVALSPRCGTMNIAHEIGHALGLWHEQSRGDRDAYIQILWENIDENYQYNFNQHLTDGQDFGEYDYQSIMHYTAYAFSKNGEKTILPLQDNVEIGQRDHLSNKDIAAVNAMYP